MGSGWNLKNMLQEVDIGTYVGVEPCGRCVDHVKEEVIKPYLQQLHKKLVGKKIGALFQEPTLKAMKISFLQVPLSTIGKL